MSTAEGSRLHAPPAERPAPPAPVTPPARPGPVPPVPSRPLPGSSTPAGSVPPGSTALEPVPPGRPRATRVSEGAMIGGVCTGLARHLGWPVLAVRIAFVALALFQFLGVLAYGALWLLLPAQPAVTLARSGGGDPHGAAQAVGAPAPRRLGRASSPSPRWAAACCGSSR